MSLVSCPFGGWICPEGMDMFGVGTHPPEDGTSGEVSTYPQTWDTTGYLRQVSGVHPIGMLSCSSYYPKHP